MNEELLIEFLSLGYRPRALRTDKSLTDKVVGDLIVLRQTEDGDRVLYLENGNSLFIPYHWIDLFDCLYLYAGDRILLRRPDIKDWMEDYIWCWMKFESDRKNYLSCLSDLCILGTGKFREWMKERYEVSFLPFTLMRTYNNTIEL